MIKLARRWSELVHCELVGFVLLVQHQRTYASQLMSDSHEPDVVLCAEVRIDRLQRFNDFNQLEIDPESNRWLALSFRRRYEFLERALRFGTKLERLIRRQSCDCCAVSSLTPLNCAGSKPQSSGSRQTGCRSAVSSHKIPTRKSSACSPKERLRRVSRGDPKNGAGSLRYRGVGAEPSFARSKSLTSTARLFGTMPEPNLRA